MSPARKAKKDYIKHLSDQIGDIGEIIVRNYFKKKGWVVYGQAFKGAAPVDGYATRFVEGKADVIAFEVKTYPRRFSYPKTGIDIADFYTYREISYAVPLTILFVDPFEKCIYALPFRDNHEKGRFEDGKVYFDLELMKRLTKLTNEDLAAIGWRPTAHYINVQKYFQ